MNGIDWQTLIVFLVGMAFGIGIGVDIKEESIKEESIKKEER